MDLNKLYKLQEELDKTILKNEAKRTGKEIDKDLLLSQTILALQVEVAELANATRCFKHWSTKGAESKERLLDEYADILHFYLSIGNQMGIHEFRLSIGIKLDVSNDVLVDVFTFLLVYISNLRNSFANEYVYSKILSNIELLGGILGFTEEEIEEAYMKKHKENYRRQEEGY